MTGRRIIIALLLLVIGVLAFLYFGPIERHHPRDSGFPVMNAE